MTTEKIWLTRGDDVQRYWQQDRNTGVTVHAREGDDTIAGTRWEDTIYGGKGDDYINGAGRNDIVKGQAGDDELHGSWGNDKVYGGPGDDEVYGGLGDDELYGGAGDDHMYGGNGNDTVLGGKGNDRIGWEWSSISPKDDGKDQYFGGAGNDVIGGRPGDKINGEHGDDFLSAATRFGISPASKGEDVIQMDGGPGKDRFELARLVEWNGAESFDKWDGGGKIVITDFQDGVDLLQMSDFSREVVEELVAWVQNDSNGNAVISWHEPERGYWGEVTLVGVDAAQVSIDDFVYGDDSIAHHDWI